MKKINNSNKYHTQEMLVAAKIINKEKLLFPASTLEMLTNGEKLH